MSKLVRDINLVVRMTREEREKLHAIAEDRDLSASTLIRHFIRDAHVARFGSEERTSKRGGR